MKAVAVMELGKIRVVDIPLPVYGDYECLVRVRACGICSSTDLKIVHNEHPEVPGFPLNFPVILGHEGVGEIVALGKKVRYLKIGDRVTCPANFFSLPDCGYCIGYGGMCEYAVALDYRAAKEDGRQSWAFQMCPEEEDFITKLFPEDISFVDAAMILTFKENYSALINFGIRDGMDVAVFGDGAVGTGLLKFLSAYKVGSSVCIGHHQDRLDKIKRIAAPGMLINAKTDDVDAMLNGKKFDIVIDAVGRVEIIRQGAKLLKPGGKVCVLGVLPKGKSALDLYDIPNFTAVQVLSYPCREFRWQQEIIELMRSGFVKASDFYSHVMPVDEAPEAFRLLEAREAFKVILTF